MCPLNPTPPGQAWLNGGLYIHWNGERERREVGMIEWAAWRRKGDGEREGWGRGNVAWLVLCSLVEGGEGEVVKV